MLLADVNVLLGAYAQADADGAVLRSWLADALAGDEAVGVSELVLSAVVRISTNPRLYANPSTPSKALDYCSAIREAAVSRIVSPSTGHWQIFADLVRETRATANLVPDAYLAALAIENGATFVTRDRGFARFPGLRILDPTAQ